MSKVINISDLLGERKPLTAKLEFRDGMILEIAFVSRSKMQQLLKTCTYAKYDAGTRKREQTVNQMKFSEEFCKLAVIGWSGFTPRTVATLTPYVDLSALTEEEKDTEIAFTHSGMMALLAESFELDAFIQDNAIEPKVFSPTHEEELGNSEPSQSGS